MMDRFISSDEVDAIRKKVLIAFTLDSFADKPFLKLCFDCVVYCLQKQEEWEKKRKADSSLPEQMPEEPTDHSEYIINMLLRFCTEVKKRVGSVTVSYCSVQSLSRFHYLVYFELRGMGDRIILL